MAKHYRSVILAAAMTCAIAAQSAGAAPAKSATFPPAFHGVWAPTADSCANPDSLARYTITATEYFQAEGGGVVQAVKPLEPSEDGRQGQAVTLELSGGGETWVETLHFYVSADGKELSIGDENGEPESGDLVRCS
jgi:hypothetical protein